MLHLLSASSSLIQGKSPSALPHLFWSTILEVDASVSFSLTRHSCLLSYTDVVVSHGLQWASTSGYHLILPRPSLTTRVSLAGFMCALLCLQHGLPQALSPLLGAKVPGFSMSTPTYTHYPIPHLVQGFTDLFNKPLLPSTPGSTASPSSLLALLFTTFSLAQPFQASAAFQLPPTLKGAVLPEPCDIPSATTVNLLAGVSCLLCSKFPSPSITFYSLQHSHLCLCSETLY